MNQLANQVSASAQVNFFYVRVTVVLMKKTHAKLQLKKNTIRVLQSSELRGVVGGGISQDPQNCSSTSCEFCPSEYSDCCATAKNC